MKLIDVVGKEHGHPFMVPDCSRDELPVFFKEMCYNIGVEVGVWEGEFTAKFCRAGLKMIGVDPWRARGSQNQHQQNARYGRALVLLSPLKCELIRKTSMEAVKDFKDESIDFVYIDGDHHYNTVLEDIQEWSKKVRKGGAISGHDYACTDDEINALPLKYQFHRQVGEAVNKCIEDFGIEDFYVFGRTKPLNEETMNDRLLSWLYIKK